MERKKIKTSDRNEVIGRQRSRCNGGCGKILDPRDTHIDHRIPLEEGGIDDIGNLQALCGSCHNRKTSEDRFRKQHLNKNREDESVKEEQSQTKNALKEMGDEIRKTQEEITDGFREIGDGIKRF